MGIWSQCDLISLLYYTCFLSLSGFVITVSFCTRKQIKCEQEMEGAVGWNNQPWKVSWGAFKVNFPAPSILGCINLQKLGIWADTQNTYDYLHWPFANQFSPLYFKLALEWKDVIWEYFMDLHTPKADFSSAIINGLEAVSSKLYDKTKGNKN